MEHARDVHPDDGDDDDLMVAENGEHYCSLLSALTVSRKRKARCVCACDRLLLSDDTCLDGLEQ